MKNETAMTYSDKALRACFDLHDQLINDDAAWGYEGTKECFDRLFAEVFVIARDELPEDCDIDQIVETFWDYNLEKMDGVRDMEWYL